MIWSGYLKKRVDEIESTHKNYFLERSPKYPTDDGDKLHNHFSYYQSDDQASIIWLHSSDLDQNIKGEVEKAFREIFLQQLD